MTAALLNYLNQSPEERLKSSPTREELAQLGKVINGLLSWLKVTSGESSMTKMPAQASTWLQAVARAAVDEAGLLQLHGERKGVQ